VTTGLQSRLHTHTHTRCSFLFYLSYLAVQSAALVMGLSVTWKPWTWSGRGLI